MDCNFPLPSDADQKPPKKWSELGFHPLGLFDLRRHLTKPLYFDVFRSRFEASDYAWFTPGLAKEICYIDRREFFPELYAIRRQSFPNSSEARKTMRLRLRDLTFDCAALLDRTFGGTTLVIYVPGTTRPNSPKAPEYVKADVYFPAHMEQESGRCSQALDDIVQRFIADIGVPTIERFERCAPSNWLNPPQSRGRQACPVEPYEQSSIDRTVFPPGSSMRQIIGRSRSPIISAEGDNDDTLSCSQHQLLDRLEYEGNLKAELASFKKKVQNLENALSESRRRECELLAEVERLIVSAAPFDNPSTPSAASGATPKTPARSKSSGLTLTTPSDPLPQNSSIPATTSVTPRRRGAQYSPLGSSSTSSRQIREGQRRLGIAENTEAESSSPYESFLKTHGLQKRAFIIEAVRTSFPEYLWRENLSGADISEDIINELMALMASLSGSG